MKRRSLIIVGAVLVALIVLGVFVVKRRQRTASGNEIVVASVIPLTGPAAEFGGYNREACDLAIEDFNSSHQGKIQVRHIFQDSKSTPKDGVNALQSILSTEHPIALQVQLSGIAMALAPIAAEKNLPMLTIAGTDGPKAVNKLSFRNYPDPTLTASQTAKSFISDKSDTRVAMLLSNDEFGLAVGAAFRKQLGQMKASLVADETYEKSSTDFRAPVTKILGNAPTVVYLVGVGNPLGRIIVQLRQLGFKGDIIGGPEIAFADVLGTAKEAAEGVRFLDLGFDAQSQEEPTRSFVERYQKRYNRLPTAVSAVVYDGWSLFLAAVDRVGSTSPDKVVEELLRTTSFRGVNGTLSVSANRDIVYPLQAKVIRGGKAVFAR